MLSACCRDNVTSTSTCVPGTTKPARLAENLGALDVELTSDELGEIDRAARAIPVQGARYPEQLQKLVGR